MNASIYRPAYSTADQAAGWLAEVTGEAWTLPRLLNALPAPVLWLDVWDDRTDAEFEQIFGRRTEGMLIVLNDQIDLARLIDGATSGTITSFTRQVDGAHFSFSPAATFALADLRFQREGIDLYIAMWQANRPAATDPT